MNRKQLAPIARIMLFTLAARLSAGGWLPPEAASMLHTSPALVELGIAALLWIGTFWAYLRSQARRALDYVSDQF